MLNAVPILFDDGVSALGVIAVAADGHIVNAEGLLVDIIVHSGLDHLQVTFGPHRIHTFQTAVLGDKPVVAQLFMGLVPVIEVLVVVVVGFLVVVVVAVV